MSRSNAQRTSTRRRARAVRAAGYVDPTTGELLPSWGDALDLVDADPDADPVHVVWSGVQVDAKGVLAGTKDADRCVGYITRYLTKQAADCHDLTTGRQRAHLEQLWQQLRHTPRSERCANWLHYGVQPKRSPGSPTRTVTCRWSRRK